MSYNPEFDRLVVTQPAPDGLEARPPEPQPLAPVAPAEPATQFAAPHYSAAAPPLYAEVSSPVRKKKSTGWILPVVIALIGLIASGSLGFLLFSTTNEREAALRHGASTQAALDKLQTQFDAQQADAAGRKVVADYVYMVERNDSRVRTDYHAMGACNSFGGCRIAVQNLYNDLQAWQAARTSAHTSPALVSPDNMLGDAISAAIAGARQFMGGMDALNTSAVIAGAKKIDAALFSITKAESAIGSVTQQNA